MSEQIDNQSESKSVNYETWFAGADDGVKSMIESKIKETLHKANSEAKNLRESKKQTESVIEKIKARFEVEDLNDEFLDQLQRLPSEKIGAEERAKQFERKYKEIEAERNKYKDELTSTQRKVAEKHRDENINSALGKIGIRSEAMELARKTIALDSVINEDGEWVYNEIPLADYIENWANDNSFLLSNPVRSGTGNNTTKRASGEMTLEFFNAQSKEWQKAHINEFWDLARKNKLK